MYALVAQASFGFCDKLQVKHAVRTDGVTSAHKRNHLSQFAAAHVIRIDRSSTRPDPVNGRNELSHLVFRLTQPAVIVAWRVLSDSQVANRRAYVASVRCAEQTLPELQSAHFHRLTYVAAEVFRGHGSAWQRLFGPLG